MLHYYAQFRPRALAYKESVWPTSTQAPSDTIIFLFAIIAVGRAGAGEPVSAVIIRMIKSEIIVRCAGKTERTVLHSVSSHDFLLWDLCFF